MLFDGINSLLAIIAVINSILGVLIVVRGSNKEINNIYSINVVAIVSWIVAMIFFRIAQQDTVIFWVKALYITPTFIASSFLYFTYIFPQRHRKTTLIHALIIFSCNAAIAIMVLLPSVVIQDVNIRSGAENEILFNRGYWFYVLYTLGFFSLGFINLWKKLYSERGVEILQTKYLLSGYAISANLAFVTNLILPWTGYYSLNWLGQVFTIFMVGFATYAILKLHLLNVKLVLTEVLIFLLITTSLVELLLTQSLTGLTLRFFILTGLIIISFFLIRSIRKEVEQREQLEELTQQLAGANQELERLDQAKSEFLSIASHQLRTPLTAIKGYSSMLLEGTYGDLKGKVKEGVEKVFASTERMVALVNDLLDTSRLDSGRMEFNFEEKSLGDVLTSVCDELVPKAKEHNTHVTCTVPQEMPKVFVDEMKIRQVVINLVDNAIKYTNAETGTVNATVAYEEAAPRGRTSARGSSSSASSSDARGEVVVRVTDNGWGMTPEERAMLFKKFSRGRGDRSVIKGTGLGLYVARRIIEAHGGRIWAESEGKGKGSTFAFALRVGWRPSADAVYQPMDD